MSIDSDTKNKQKKTYTCIGLGPWHDLSYFTTNTLWSSLFLLKQFESAKVFIQMKHGRNNTFTIIFYPKLLLMNGLVVYFRQPSYVPTKTLWSSKRNTMRLKCEWLQKYNVRRYSCSCQNKYHRIPMFLF